MKPKLGPPRYDLLAAQKAEVQISRTVAARANELLGLHNTLEVLRHIERLFLSLQREDYVHTALMVQRAGQPLQGDVYRKVDEYGVWYIKFRLEENTIVLSCHEAEHNLLTLLEQRERSKR